MKNHQTLYQTVLIVDDDKSNRKILKELLQEHARIVFAKNGCQALELANKHQPDLILMDVIMPDLSGFEVIEQLKNDPVTMNISVIFITGLTNSDDEARGFNLGGCDYIYKPFKPNIVIARVMMHLELISQRKMLDEIAHIDALTGVSNRRKLDLVLASEVSANKREKNHLLVAVLDIDFFKQYNDNYGHGAGDLALKKVGLALKDVLQRPRDFVARYGGEEFVVVIPDCNLACAEMVLANIKRSIKDKNITHEYSDVSPFLTVSIGAVLVDDNQEHTVKTIFEKADCLLYQAKQQGRNKYKIEKLATVAERELLAVD